MSHRVSVHLALVPALKPGRIANVFALAALFASAQAPPALAKTGSAGGAPVGDLLWASTVAVVLSAAVLWVAVAHRSGRISWLARAVALAQRATGLPGWSIVPIAVAGASLVIAVVGFYWDVAKHIDTGRDAGPFGTVAHYPILVGLAGITLAGFLAIVLGCPEDVPTGVRIRDGWRAPLGGLLIFLCGGLALTGFPLDDVWHTLFGQDVTLWGPTHILMVGGASLSTLGLWVLLLEGRRAGEAAPGWVAVMHAHLGGVAVQNEPNWLDRLALAASRRSAALRGLIVRGLERGPAVAHRLGEVAAGGAFLIGLSTLQGEFDYGVPQFQLVYQPILIALAASIGLVAVRCRRGRGSALGAALFYCATFGLMSVFVASLGLSRLHFPLYLAEAALVELAALALSPAQNPVGFGLLAGLLVGTAGVAAEWGFSHVWMPLPWPASMLGQTAALAPAAALAGGVIGAYAGRALNAGERAVRPRKAAVSSWLLPLAGLVAAFCIAYPLPTDAGSPASAIATLRTLTPGPHRTVAATFRFASANTADDAQWVQVIDWQGGGLVVDRLARVAEGVYSTTRPIPVGGKWKAILRVANGRSLRGVPIYLPADPDIPAKGVPASARFTRPFEREKQILQREAVGGPSALSTVAYLVLALVVLGWLSALVYGMRRLQLSSSAGDTPPGGRRPPRAALGGAG
jgi:hypothetical protein